MTNKDHGENEALAQLKIEIPRAIRETLDNDSITITDLAERLKTSRAAVYRLLRGEFDQGITLGTIEKIRKVCGGPSLVITLPNLQVMSPSALDVVEPSTPKYNDKALDKIEITKLEALIKDKTLVRSLRGEAFFIDRSDYNRHQKLFGKFCKPQRAFAFLRSDMEYILGREFILRWMNNCEIENTPTKQPKEDLKQLFAQKEFTLNYGGRAFLFTADSYEKNQALFQTLHLGPCALEQISFPARAIKNALGEERYQHALDGINKFQSKSAA